MVLYSMLILKDILLIFFRCCSEQKVVQYEQYVRDLQAHNRAVANCQEAPNGISYQDLQQEVFSFNSFFGHLILHLQAEAF